MLVDGTARRTIWLADDGWTVEIIDQTLLPHRFEVVPLRDLDAAAYAISAMLVRGAPLIGATAAYGIALAMRADPSDRGLEHGCAVLKATRPTAVNLLWALDDARGRLEALAPEQRAAAAYARAAEICEEDVATNQAIGDHGLEILKGIAERKADGAPVRVLTHCNAGWLATVDWGTATAPLYKAQQAGLPIKVWVDETRPRNQGASLTAWELGRAGIPHKLIVDNAGGHLMQHGLVDLCIVGTDRTTASGDVCNKIGTYLKALAAHDNGVPFYVALPSTTIDWALEDGVRDIPIEERASREVTHLTGATDSGELYSVRIVPEGTGVANPAFDVTPRRLVTGLITERGVSNASWAGISSLFPEKAKNN